jgi:hypothetical protein
VPKWPRCGPLKMMTHCGVSFLLMMDIVQVQRDIVMTDDPDQRSTFLKQGRNVALGNLVFVDLFCMCCVFQLK